MSNRPWRRANVSASGPPALQVTPHTPGPWMVGELRRDEDGDFVRAIRADSPGGPYICDVWPMGEDFDPDSTGAERDANARLIAQSPALLDACREVHEMLTTGGADADTIADAVAVLEVALTLAIKGPS